MEHAFISIFKIMGGFAILLIVVAIISTYKHYLRCKAIGEDYHKDLSGKLDKLTTENKTMNKDKLKVGSYYPFVMKNGNGHHKCVGYITKGYIYVTNMHVAYEKEDILWVGDEIEINFPEEFCQPEYL